MKARAALLLADLATLTGERDFARAMELSQHAIGTVLPLANAEEQQRRVAAKRILIDAHLEIAGIVAQGEWQQKEKSVQQWLDRAKALADDFVQNEAGDSGVYFDVLCKRLDAYAWLEGAVDPASTVKELQLRKANLTGGSTDPTYQRHVQWQYAKAMIDAVDIQRAREEKTAALDYGKIADEIVTKHAGGSWNREVIQFQRSRLYFLLGSIQAVQFRDHAAAVKWFDKSIDDISRPEPDRDLALTVRRGQWMVSMGISYWHVGRKSTGLKLTEAGLALIVNSHDDEPADAKLLSAPYNNLAFMHGQLGDEAKSKHYAAMANRLNVETQR